MIGYAGKLARYLRHTRAVSALEYAMIVGVIAIAIATALSIFSGNITTVLDTIGTQVGTVGN